MFARQKPEFHRLRTKDIQQWYEQGVCRTALQFRRKGKGNDIAILEKEISELTELMINHYGKGTEVGKQVEHYRTLFKALPEKAHIITYWATADTRIALVLNRDDADSKNDYYYVHAEPVLQ